MAKYFGHDGFQKKNVTMSGEESTSKAKLFYRIYSSASNTREICVMRRNKIYCGNMAGKGGEWKNML